jgi:hypothetical protein
VADLVVKRPATLKAKGGKLITALLTGLKNPSASIRSTYADALGHVAAISVQKRVQELVNSLVTMYNSEADDSSHAIVAYTLLQLAIRASDALKKVCGLCRLPAGRYLLYDSFVTPTAHTVLLMPAVYA